MDGMLLAFFTTSWQTLPPPPYPSYGAGCGRVHIKHPHPWVLNKNINVYRKAFSLKAEGQTPVIYVTELASY